MTAWLFGKLPVHGDFVARGTTAGERDALDEWLSASLADAREGLGPAFDAAYEGAPAWRFALPGPSGWTAGALAPSVDAVGRRYPILVARRGLGDDRVEPAAAACEALLYEALGQGWDADRLSTAATAAEPAGAEPWTNDACWWTVDSDGAMRARIAGVYPPSLMRAALTVQEGDPCRPN